LKVKLVLLIKVYSFYKYYFSYYFKYSLPFLISIVNGVPIQDLQRQLRVLNEQNKNLRRQLKQNQNITIKESSQNVCNLYNFEKICLK